MRRRCFRRDDEPAAAAGPNPKGGLTQGGLIWYHSLFLPQLLPILVVRLPSIPSSSVYRLPGLVNYVSALAYHFCLALPTAFTQPGEHLSAEPSTG